MEGIALDVNALRRDYRDTITQLSNTAVHGKNVDDELIDYGAEVGLVDKLGRTLLHRSARLGYGAATKLLVDRWSVVTTEDNDGRTARDLAEGSDRAIKAHDGEEPDFYMYKDRMILL
jgi:ankyrin repeat protein